MVIMQSSIATVSSFIVFFLAEPAFGTCDLDSVKKMLLNEKFSKKDILEICWPSKSIDSKEKRKHSKSADKVNPKLYGTWILPNFDPNSDWKMTIEKNKITSKSTCRKPVIRYVETSVSARITSKSIMQLSSSYNENRGCKVSLKAGKLFYKIHGDILTIMPAKDVEQSLDLKRAN